MLPMTVQQYFPQAAEQVALVVGNAAPSTLDLPTPCADFSLQALLQHFFGTTTALARLGRREPLDDNDPYGAQVDWLGEGWQQRLAANVRGVAEAWTSPGAWEGTVSMGGQPAPATMIGEMSFAEVLLHGWDVARTTGQPLTVSDELGRELRRGVEETAEMGRSMGAYGTEVHVPEDASAFDRALGAAGRDPRWRAG